jgi:hypothetical protein
VSAATCHKWPARQRILDDKVARDDILAQPVHWHDMARVPEGGIAKAAWLGVTKKRGKPIPKPKYRPAIYQLAR